MGASLAGERQDSGSNRSPGIAPSPSAIRPVDMQKDWKESIYLQREHLAHILREPLTELAGRCAGAWGERERLNRVLADSFARIPYCTYLYCLAPDGVQVSDNIGAKGVVPGHAGRNRSERPYMREPVPPWGFLLSDAYISLRQKRPSLTALQIVWGDGGNLGYLGADFDLRDLPATAEPYQEPDTWRQVKGDPAIRGHLFQQCRIESPMDRNLGGALSILEELLTEHGVFQTQIHFSSSQALIWTLDDPFRYRILDHEALGDPDICLVYPSRPYPSDAVIESEEVGRILERLGSLRTADENIYLRQSSINLFNGLVSLTFSCDGSHYMPHRQFLDSGSAFWFGEGV